MNSWLTLLPPLVAISFAIGTRHVIPSLLLGILAGTLILSEFALDFFIFGTIEVVVKVLKDPGNICVLLFSLLIGSIVHLIRDSGGVKGFVTLVTHRGIASTPKKSSFLVILLGVILFIEGTISILTVGTVGRPLFRRFKMSLEKLAYLADATCAPIAVLIPINGWGAYILAQLAQGGVKKPVELLIQSIPYFFYPMCAFALVVLVVTFGWDWGFRKHQTTQAEKGDPQGVQDNDEPASHGHAAYFLVPIGALIFNLFLFLFLTGGGDILSGDGSRSILMAIVATITITYVQYRLHYVFEPLVFVNKVWRGAWSLREIVSILALAFMLNSVCRELGTGIYVAGVLKSHIPMVFLPALIFVVSAFVAFATGTSWGTFAIMLSVGLPMAGQLDLHLPLVVGAIVSGGVWGDHSSPISDTTVISSLASGSGLIEHVKTQMPYALVGASLSVVLFLIFGAL